MSGKLYLIPSPLNPETPLSDFLPAGVIEITSKLTHFIVEDEKTVRRYLKRTGITTPLNELMLFPLNKFTEETEFAKYIKPLLDGIDMGIVSEAGCPGIADPGAEIVKLAHQNKIKVIPLVGPSSILLALMASGLNGQNFAFNGYIPIEQKERIKRVKQLEGISRQFNQSQILIETPYRNNKLLETILSVCDNSTHLCIATEITGPQQRISTHTISEWNKRKPELNKKQVVFIIQG
jgi:16S rRNA (cytidine1402-2'-O)-methyltransferase